MIYIFPTGDALMNRNAATANATLAAYPQQKDQHHKELSAQTLEGAAPAPDESAWVDELLAAGKLTVAQVQVARYDQSATGMSLQEALMLRGWL